MSDSKKTNNNLLGKYMEESQAPPLPKLVKSTAKSDYEAFKELAGSSRSNPNDKRKRAVEFSLICNDGVIYDFAYSTILYRRYSPSIISIQTTAVTITLEGKNLMPLRESLKKGSVEEIQEYDSVKHSATTEKQTVISAITVTELFGEE